MIVYSLYSGNSINRIAEFRVSDYVGVGLAPYPHFQLSINRTNFQAT